MEGINNSFKEHQYTYTYCFITFKNDSFLPDGYSNSISSNKFGDYILFVK